MAGGRGNLNMGTVKISGTGTVIPSTPEQIEQMKKEAEVGETKNPMDAIISKEEADAQPIPELPEEIREAADKLKQAQGSGLEIGTVDAPEIGEEEYKEKMAVPDTESKIPIRTDPMPTESTKKEFNPNTVANAASNESLNESGGITLNRTPSDKEEVKEGGIEKTKEKASTITESVKNMYELTGFSVQYREEGSADIVSRDVRDYYHSPKEAQESINGFKYQTQDGIKATITRGAPIICFNEREIFDYIDEKWRRP